MGKPEELTCPRKQANCHPLDLIAAGDDFTCCGAREAIGECHRGAVGLLPFCVCMVEPGKDMAWYYKETQLLNMVSVVTRALSATKE